jgi:serine/threonine protein kinase
MAMLASFNRHQVLREVRLHASLDHPHIIQLYAAFQVRWVGQAY